MDAFKVPKKVNRHVLKALNILSDENNRGTVTTSQIIDQVQYQMRNLVPVANIETVIQKSLRNLSDNGLIERTGPKRFAPRRSSVAAPLAPKSNKPKAENRNIFKPGGSRKRSTSELNPNSRRVQYDSEDSLSGDEYDRTRKRMRTNNKKVNYAGRNTDLPNARKHYRFDNLRESPIDFNTPNMMSYLSESSLQKNLQMEVYIGPESNSNTDFDLSTKSLMQPLKITEIFCENSIYKPIESHAPAEIEQLNIAERVDNDGSTNFSFHSHTNLQTDQQPSRNDITHSSSAIVEKSKTSLLVSKSEFNSAAN